MEIKKIFGALLLLTVLVSISFSSAITGSIGNARMILRVTEGDTIERSILVKNVNDIAVDVDVYASGDLENDVIIEDESFRLEPDSEKKAFFNIKIKEAGTTETTINVRFSPIDGGNGVGLVSTVIVIANESEKEDNGWNFWGGGDFGGEENSNKNNESSGNNDGSGVSIESVILLLLLILVVLLVIVVIMLKKNKFKKDVRKGE